MTLQSASGTITPAALTITATSDSKVYDGTTTSGQTPAESGLITVSGDTLTGLSQAFTSKDVLGTGGSTLTVEPGYTVNDGNGGADYTVTLQSATGTITPAALTITATSDSKVYDGTTTSGQTPAESGLITVSGDTLTGLSQAFTSKDVLGTGGSTLTVGTGYTVNDGNGGSDYTVTLQSATGTITPAALTITATSDSKVYDGTTTSGQTPAESGLITVSGDTLSGLSQAFTSKDVLGTGGSTLTVETGYTVNDGNGGSDYAVTLQSAAGTITPAALTITATSDSKVYDGTTTSDQTPAESGLITVSGDTLSGLSQAFTSKDVLGTGGSTLVVEASYTVNDDNGGSDYTVTLQSATGTITPAALTITAASDSKVYDGTTTSGQTPAESGLIMAAGDTLSGLSQAFTSKDVLGKNGSTLVVEASYSVNDGNGGADYAVTLQSAAGTITPASLTITATSDSKVYDGTTTSGQTPAESGLITVSGDTLSGLSQAFTSKDVLGTNGSTLTVEAGYTVNDGNGGADYAVTLQSATGTITPAALTITATSDSKVYDGTTTSGQTPAESGLITVSGDTLSGLSQAFTSKDVLGTGGSTLTVGTGYTVNDGNGGADYTVTLQSASGTITPAALTITATSDSKVYDGTTTSGQTPAESGLITVSGDTLSGLSQAFTSKDVLGTGGSTLTVEAGYTVNDGNGGADYAVTLQSAAGTITPAALTITATSDSKVYDGTTTSGQTPAESGLITVSGDTLSGLSQAFTSKDVLGTGGSTLTVEAGYTVNDGNGGADYTVTLQSAAGTITPAALTITATSDSKVYDGTTTSGQTPAESGLITVSGDTLSGLSQAFTSKDVLGTGGSTLTVEAGYTVNDGNGGSDYAVTLQSAAGTITPAALTITATSDSKVYDGTTTSGQTPAESGLITVSGDTLSGLSQAFTSKDVLGTGGSTLTVEAGYTVNDGNGGADYTVTLQSATGTITPAALTITATSDSKVYDGTTTSGQTPAESGLITVSGDTLTGLSQAFTSKDVLGTGGSTLVVEASYTVNDGNGGADYTVTLQSASGTITPAALTITATSDSKVYDGTTTSGQTPAESGLITVSGDTLSGLSQAFTSKDVLGTGGSTLVVEAGYTVNDGNGGADYAVTLQSASGTITPAALTITATSDSKVYDGTTTSGQTPAESGLITAAGDTLSGLSQAFTSKDVLGTGGSTLTVEAGYTVNDGNGGADYTVTLQSAAGTITPAALTITATSDSKVYDGTTTSGQTPAESGLITVSGDTLTGLSQAFTSKDVLGTGGSTLAVEASYTVNDGNGGADYAVTLQSAAGTITPAALTITATSDSKVYDGTTTSGQTPAESGLITVSGDTLSGLSQAFTSKDVLGTGGSTLTVEAGYTVNDGNGGADYTVTLQSATGTITPAALTITATSDSKVYDGTTTSGQTPAESGLITVSGDTLTGLSQAFTSKDVLGTGGSTLTVEAGYTVNDGNGGADYTVTLQSASGTITPAALTITATSDSKVYDGTTTSGQTPAESGLIMAAGDTLNGLSQAFTSKDVHGTNGSTLVVEASYTVNDGNGGADYAVTLQSASGTITPAALTITAKSDSKVYDGTTTSGQTPAESGLITAAGDTLSGLSQAFTSKDVLGTGSSTLTVEAGYTVNDGNGGADYAVTLQSASGTITPAALTITATSDSKVYDGTTTRASRRRRTD